MKKVTITIQEAPAYDLTKKGEVINVDTQETVVPDEGNNVNLVVKEGDETKTLILNVNDLVSKYFPKKEKAEKGPKKVTGAAVIREEYDKDPANFDIKAFSEASGIPYGRVYGCIKKYKAAKEKN